MLGVRDRTAPVTLLTVDIEDFRLVNESFGQAAGDVTLREVARRLGQIAGPDGVVGRVGGDRFVLVDPEPADADPAALRRYADDVRADLARPYAINGVDFRLEVNIGASAWPDPACDAAGLLEQSERALRRAKRDGNGSVSVYITPTACARERLTLTARLSRAMARGELELHYQPIVPLDPGRVVPPSFEALLRWSDPERGQIPPATFIPVAEQSDLIHELGEWVIDDACRQLAHWTSRGLDPKVAVNLSPRQLGRADLTDRVHAALTRHDIQGERLYLELTESAVTNDADRVEELLEVLAALGTPLSIDDFGTGESSLTRLRDLPFRALKLDRSFLKHLPGTRTDGEVVEAVLRLADALGMVSVAEGVETEEQHAFLVAHRCTFAQGFLYARPMPASDAERLMRAPGGITSALRARR
jgi:diguanylate cyclase (GGDEF)-like protein